MRTDNTLLVSVHRASETTARGACVPPPLGIWNMSSGTRTSSCLLPVTVTDEMQDNAPPQRRHGGGCQTDSTPCELGSRRTVGYASRPYASYAANHASILGSLCRGPVRPTPPRCTRTTRVGGPTHDTAAVPPRPCAAATARRPGR